MSLATIEITNGVGWITLNREDRLNAINREMALELQRLLDVCRDNDIIRAVCLSGRGRSFCSGQDLTEVLEPNATDIEKILSEQLNPIITRIRKLPKPIVAAVHGVAAGAGANIALCCDVVVATESAAFSQAFSKIGLIPDCGGTYILPRLIGWQKATALMMLGEKVSGIKAERIGMIYKVFPDNELLDEARKIVSILASMPTTALALTKDALSHSAYSNLDQQLEYEDKLQSIAGRSADFREGIAAFLQKRPPVFTGK